MAVHAEGGAGGQKESMNENENPPTLPLEALNWKSEMYKVQHQMKHTKTKQHAITEVDMLAQRDKVVWVVFHLFLSLSFVFLRSWFSKNLHSESFSTRRK